MGFSPGPWTFEGSVIQEAGYKGSDRVVARTEGEDARANACLISFAPAMLDALEEIGCTCSASRLGGAHVSRCIAHLIAGATRYD